MKLASIRGEAVWDVLARQCGRDVIKSAKKIAAESGLAPEEAVEQAIDRLREEDMGIAHVLLERHCTSD